MIFYLRLIRTIGLRSTPRLGFSKINSIWGAGGSWKHGNNQRAEWENELCGRESEDALDGDYYVSHVIDYDWNISAEI